MSRCNDRRRPLACLVVGPEFLAQMGIRKKSRLRRRGRTRRIAEPADYEVHLVFGEADQLAGLEETAPEAEPTPNTAGSERIEITNVVIVSEGETAEDLAAAEVEAPPAEEPPAPGLMSLSRNVPTAVPSVTQSSLPLVPSVAVKSAEGIRNST